MSENIKAKPITFEQVLELTIDAGQLMLESGAETYRVEQTMNVIMHKLTGSPCSAYATITGITACIEDSDNMKSIVRRVPSRDTNLYVVHVVNQVSRDLAADKLDYAQAKATIDRLKADRTYNSTSRKALGLILMSPAFTLLLSGSPMDVLLSMITSIATVIINYLTRILKLKSIISLGLAALLSALSIRILQVYIFTGANYNLIIAANLMPLFPGTAITNAIRDTINGDYVSASARGIEAIVTATFLAIGTGIGLWISGVITAWVW